MFLFIADNVRKRRLFTRRYVRPADGGAQISLSFRRNSIITRKYSFFTRSALNYLPVLPKIAVRL